MHPAARTWFTRRTTATGDWSRARVQADKRDQRVTVIIPARDEESTIGAIVRSDEVLIAHDSTRIETDDHIILFMVDKKHIVEVEKLFQVSAIFI